MPTIEELTQQMSEVSTKVETLSTQLTEAQTNLTAEKEARVAAETRVKTLEDASRRRRFSDMVEGRGGETDGLRWYGEIDQHVQTLTSLAEAVGEEADAFKNYVASQVSLAKTIAASPLMQEMGSTQANTEPDSLAGLVKKYREDNPGKSEAEATTEVLAANPHLYAESVRAQNRAIKRGE